MDADDDIVGARDEGKVSVEGTMESGYGDLERRKDRYVLGWAAMMTDWMIMSHNLQLLFKKKYRLFHLL